MLHPAMAHFAVTLPIISMILGLAYLYRQNELMSKVSSRFFVFAAIFMIAAYFTGKEDGSEIYILLSGEGKEILSQHKDIGTYLAIAMGIAAIIKYYGCFRKNFKAEIFSIILVTIIALGTLYQGKLGGDLVYGHGAHVTNHSDGMDCLEDPEFFIGE
jgi:uncharacterized membrane protein